MADLKGTDRDLSVDTDTGKEHQWDKYAARPVPSTHTGMRCIVCGAISDEESGHLPCPGIEVRYGPTFEAKITELEQRVANMTPADAVKIVKGLVQYGRAEIAIPLSDLAKVFAPKNVGIVYVEYDHRTEQLLITVDGDGLPQWQEGARPFRVGGCFTAGSYIMADVKGKW